jgi:hypothetical protein
MDDMNYSDNLGRAPVADNANVFNPVVLYLVTFICFGSFIAIAQLRHWDWIPGHVTPFYAMFDPRRPNIYFLLAAAYGAFCIVALRCALKEPLGIRMGYLVCILIICGTALHVVIAMMDGGPAAVAAPYSRWGYEYFGDVPWVRNPVQFLRDYVRLMPHLSMHSRVHPPGPVLMLWFISLFAGDSPLAVSIGSVALSNVSIVPIYFFARQLFGQRAALYSVLLYFVAPTVVMFSATSADTLFTLFTASSLCFFAIAMERSSRLSAALAGLSFALTLLMSFNLAVLSLFFAVVGVRYVMRRETRARTIQCFGAMVFGFLLFYAIVCIGTQYDVITCFLTASRQLKTDLMNQDLFTPRAPYITWRFGTPIAVLFFAGIPAAGLFVVWLKRCIRRDNTGLIVRDPVAYFIGAVATLIAFDLLYFGRGEGERAWVFLLPLIIVPAGAMIARFTRKPGAVILWTVAVTIVQTFVMEALLFTYW